ncbi:MAG: glycosyltransferase [Patescibacteria group bacterium]|jgi:glycosyltransferase involved in cell wall biosynthesis|nr:glycosyltransferase [Patescibacteria group bacterium]MDD5172988.1 glycosyltransferase [Patescibacteria group bacterium]
MYSKYIAEGRGMKVALIHDFLTQYGGAEKVLECFHKIWPTAPIFTLFYDQEAMRDKFIDCDIRVSPIQNLPFGVKKYRWYLPLMPSAVERFNLKNFDLVISDCSAYAKGVITQPGTCHFSYIHTPTRYLWSDAHNYLDSLKGGEKIASKIIAPLLNRLRIWDYLAAQRPNALIANSKFVAQRIKHYYHRESTVIYPPVETDKFKISEKIDKYFLVVSRLRPYKRVDLAVQAFNHLKIPLKIIGGGESRILKKMAGPHIEFLGILSNQKRADYMSRCQALIFPQEEDFGITAVEAMASGRPVIAYQAGGALEIIKENKTGQFFKEQTWESLAEAVVKFKIENFNSNKIREHALQFNQERFKEEIKSFVQNYKP